MTTTYTRRLILLLLSFAVCAFAFAALPVSANEDEDHDEAHEEEAADEEVSDRFVQMQQLLALLQQVAALLEERLATTGHVHDDSHEHVSDVHDEDEHAHDEGDDNDTLVVTAEVHEDRTHIHVFEPGEDEVTFFLDDLDISEEAAIVTAIAEETDLTEDEINEVITFPSDHEESEEHEDDEEDGDAHDEHEDEEGDGLDGIHIMADGSVMLGSGETLDTATVTDEGMIMLEDGTLVEPEYDLRDDSE